MKTRNQIGGDEFHLIVLRILTVIACMACMVAGLSACLTSKTVTTNPNGTFTTNTVVNQGQLDIDCAVVQLNTAIGVSLAIQKDPAIVPTLKNVSLALSGVLNGASTNSAAQLLAVIGQNNPVIAANIGPVVTQASDLEQKLLKKYGSGVAGQIAVAIVTAFNNGLTAGLAGK